MEAFEVRDLSFAYPEQRQDTLSHLSFSIPQGQFVTLCGPSGCGKSTLLRRSRVSLCIFGAVCTVAIYGGIMNPAAALIYANMEELAEQRKAELNEIITWADIYENSTLERKKMIVTQLIKRVTVGRGYQVSVEFNITFDELQRAITGEYAEETGICTTFLPELKLENSA